MLKKFLSDTLRYYQYKLDNNLCTMEEMESVAKALESNITLYGTIEDFAKFYDVSEGNVRSTINRKLAAKPKRKVFYPFHKFSKIVPEKWKKKDGFHE